MIHQSKASFFKNALVTAIGLVGFAALSQLASAATLCVNPSGTGGCFKTIKAAITAASPNDTIQVSPGTYKEDVVIGKSLSLVGVNSTATIINAQGLPHGIHVDGKDHPGLKNVVVSGFTIENANFEGILITNASSVTVWQNVVVNNDRSLNTAKGTCPGQPSFETNENFDCGEGIHLTGVDHSVVSGNTVTNNSGGILLSDDTGSTHDNLINQNLVLNNPYDCGITLASHPPASFTGSKTPLGVFHNTILLNESAYNGTQFPGTGAGVGIFTGVSGGMVSGNVISQNLLTGNGLPGVAFHAHGPGEDLNDNLIAGNVIGGNGADTDDAATPGPTGINVFGASPIKGTIISNNVISGEAEDVVTNTDAQVDVHLNSFAENSIGVDNIGSGTVNATENWWGCATGPGTDKCATVAGPDVLFTPWLTAPLIP